MKFFQYIEMKTNLRFLLTAASICTLPFTAHASSILPTVPTTAPAPGLYFQNDDAVTFNFQILNAATGGTIPIPATPSGIESNAIRMFTGVSANGRPAANDAVAINGTGGTLDFVNSVAFTTQGTPSDDNFAPNVFDQDGDEDNPVNNDNDFNFNHINPATTTLPTTPTEFVPSWRFAWGVNFNDDHIDTSQTLLDDSLDIGNGDANHIVTVDDVLNFINHDPSQNFNSPLFVLDMSQAQVDSGKDLYIRADVALVDFNKWDTDKPALAPLFDDLTGTDLDFYLDGAGDWEGDGFAKIFHMSDAENFTDETDQSAGSTTELSYNPSDDDFVHTPGTFSQSVGGTVFNANIGGAGADWGAFIPEDFNPYREWAFLVRISTKNDTGSFEEYYISGGVAVGVDTRVIPTPSASLAGLLGFGLLATLRRKR